MIITKIRLLNDHEEDKKILSKFLSDNKNGVKTFRYYNKRDFSVINNHIYSALYYNEDNILGYGHLDTENDVVWLGIMVSDKYRGMGIGTTIMKDLIKHYDGDILLSVDKDNTPAINIYKKRNFNIFEVRNDIIIMKLEK